MEAPETVEVTPPESVAVKVTVQAPARFSKARSPLPAASTARAAPAPPRALTPDAAQGWGVEALVGSACPGR